MGLVWKASGKPALPDFKNFIELEYAFPCSKYVTIEEYNKLKLLYDNATTEIVTYYSKQQQADKAKKENKSAPVRMIGGRKKIFTDSQIAEIEKCYSEGKSKRAIAKIFSCSEKTIRNYLKARG